MSRVESWLNSIGWGDYKLNIASVDASFRRYFRLSRGDESYILMDSSLEKESLAPFVDITSRLLQAGVKAPKIYKENLRNGYLIIEDFGNSHYLDLLNESNYKSLYLKAIDEIVKMQNTQTSKLPLYDKKFLHFEMSLMPEWFLKKYLNLTLEESQKELIERAFNAVSLEVLSQPQNIFVHRDYHSRNMLLTPQGEIGVIDYQDAMSGGLTYDLVSLLKDCYVYFKPSEIDKLALQFRDKIGLEVEDETFLKWFDFTGMQRHIKVLGIFSRLYLRDGKDGYLDDLPLTLKYTIDSAQKYEETQELAALLRTVKLPY